MRVCHQDGKPSLSYPTGLFSSEKGSAMLLPEEPVAIPEKCCFNTTLLAVAAMGFLPAGADGRDVL